MCSQSFSILLEKQGDLQPNILNNLIADPERKVKQCSHEFCHSCRHISVSVVVPSHCWEESRGARTDGLGHQVPGVVQAAVCSPPSGFIFNNPFVCGRMYVGFCVTLYEHIHCFYDICCFVTTVKMSSLSSVESKLLRANFRITKCNMGSEHK